MIKDKDTNIVYLSRWLSDSKEGYPDFYSRLTDLFDKLDIKWDLLNYTNDFWVRDFMPIQISTDVFLKYKYYPDNLVKVKGRKKYITDCLKACESLGLKCKDTNIILDGGNVVSCGDYIVMTDKVFEENGVAKNDKNLVSLIERTFQHKVIFIKWKRHCALNSSEGDVYGHADGFIKYCGDNKILMSNHRDFYEDEADCIRRELETYGFDVTEMLFDVSSPNMNLNWAYINFLQVGKDIIMPCFGIDEDVQAYNYIKNKFPECGVHMIEMSDIVQEGGALHCLTWNIIR